MGLKKWFQIAKTEHEDWMEKKTREGGGTKRKRILSPKRFWED